jgi:hypothetical protein
MAAPRVADPVMMYVLSMRHFLNAATKLQTDLHLLSLFRAKIRFIYCWVCCACTPLMTPQHPLPRCSSIARPSILCNTCAVSFAASPAACKQLEVRVPSLHHVFFPVVPLFSSMVAARSVGSTKFGIVAIPGKAIQELGIQSRSGIIAAGEWVWLAAYDALAVRPLGVCCWRLSKRIKLLG